MEDLLSSNSNVVLSNVWLLTSDIRKRGKYEHPGDDGKLLPRDVFKGQLEKLLVGFNVEDVAVRMRRSLPVSPFTLVINRSLYYLSMPSLYPSVIVNNTDLTARAMSPSKLRTTRVSTSASCSPTSHFLS